MYGKESSTIQFQTLVNFETSFASLSENWQKYSGHIFSL